MRSPDVSVIVPVYNEEEGLAPLFARLYSALDALGVGYEIVFINDGSRDRSAALLREQFQRRPDVTRVILFNGNFGQHMAIMAGFAHARGRRLVTLDADLQNPPEEIGNLKPNSPEPIWRRYLPNMEVRQIPGSHLTMVETDVASTAAAITRCATEALPPST